MESVIVSLQTVLDFISRPDIRPFALFGVGYLLKKAPEVKNRVIPAALTVLSLVGSIIQAVMPDTAPAIPATAGYVAAVSINPAVDFIVTTAIGVWLPTGAHSWAKNLWQWAKEGFGVSQKKA